MLPLTMNRWRARLAVESGLRSFHEKRGQFACRQFHVMIGAPPISIIGFGDRCLRQALVIGRKRTDGVIGRP
jgi:hypothetical protein